MSKQLKFTQVLGQIKSAFQTHPTVGIPAGAANALQKKNTLVAILSTCQPAAEEFSVGSTPGFFWSFGPDFSWDGVFSFLIFYLPITQKS